MKRMGWVVLAMVMGSGCASVKVMQREGCWVRQTRNGLGGLKEELGPCARPEPAWSQDRLMRLVQECVAHDDYRWQGRALAAWNRGEPIPEHASEAEVLDACMAQARSILATEKNAVEQRLSEVTKERDALRASVEQERDQSRASLEKEREANDARLDKEREAFLGSVEQNSAHLRASNTQLAGALGEAAKKPAPSAIATATSTSEGRADTKTDSSLESRRAKESRKDSRSTVPAPRPTSASATEPTPRDEAPVQAPAPACAQPALAIPAAPHEEQAQVFVPVPPGLPGATK